MIGWCSTTLKPADFQLLHESEHVVCFNSSVAGVWRRSCNRIGGHHCSVLESCDGLRERM